VGASESSQQRAEIKMVRAPLKGLSSNRSQSKSVIGDQRRQIQVRVILGDHCHRGTGDRRFGISCLAAFFPWGNLGVKPK
jgi:hypothetical protein